MRVGWEGPLGLSYPRKSRMHRFSVFMFYGRGGEWNAFVALTMAVSRAKKVI